MGALNDRKVRTTQPPAKGTKPLLLVDGAGLYLRVFPSGTKTWLTKYEHAGRQVQISLGNYPAMSLAQARTAREAVRGAVREKRSPRHEQIAARDANLAATERTFEREARCWHAERSPGWSAKYATAILQSFERHVFPVIGTVPLRMVTREDIKKVLLKAREKVLLKGRERGGMAAADAVRRHLDEVFAHWIELEWIDRNPAAGKGPKDLTPHESKPRDAVKTMEDARRVMAIMDAAPRKMLRLAHRFQALTGMRPFEAQGARWDEFKVPGQWTIPAERMKGRRGRKRSHTVYLSRQAQDVLDAAKALAPLGEEYVFWGKRGRPLRRDAVGDYMFRALPDDLKHVPHGWRSTFSTIMNKRRRGDGERELIDTMIAHATRGASGAEAHYRRLTEEDFPEARSIGQEWADLLLADAQSAWALAGLDDAQPQPGPQAQPQPDPPQDDWRTAIWQQFFPERAAA